MRAHAWVIRSGFFDPLHDPGHESRERGCGPPGDGEHGSEAIRARLGTEPGVGRHAPGGRFVGERGDLGNRSDADRERGVHSGSVRLAPCPPAGAEGLAQLGLGRVDCHGHHRIMPCLP